MLSKDGPGSGLFMSGLTQINFSYPFCSVKPHHGIHVSINESARFVVSGHDIRAMSIVVLN